MHRYLLAALACQLIGHSLAHVDSSSTLQPKKPWFETFAIRGYGQVRYNRLLETNDKFKCEQCDRSVGDGGGFFIRRARIIFQGFVHKQVFIYLQPDFASTAGSTNGVAQVRDWYVDVGLDAENEFRFRLGQSKVPYSFENLQSSQNRLPLDRADATNSAASNERDLGAFFYWAPRTVRERYKMLVDEGLKGSGDYGVFALGFFNGQTTNRPEANNSPHAVARLSWPFTVGDQIIETSLAGYAGEYVVTADQRSSGVKWNGSGGYRDERVLGTVAIYPHPFGLLAEYNVGRGPQFDPLTDSIGTHALRGGFATLFYRASYKQHVFFPFIRYQMYDGGKKHELDARSYRVNDLEFGVEWQPIKNFELVCEYYIGDRRFEDYVKQENKQQGQLLRIQAQLNF
jgi:Phosphate-selective porin O and P